MIINFANNLRDFIAAFIKATIKNLIDEHSGMFTDYYKGIFSVEFMTRTDSLFDMKFKHNGDRINKEYVSKSMDEYDAQYHNSLMYSDFEGDAGGEMFKLTNIRIVVLTDSLYSFMIDNIYRYDEMLKEITIVLMHELGHIMHFISLDNMLTQDVEKIISYCEKATQEFFENIEKNNLDINDAFYEYNNLPYEKIANENVNLKPEQLDFRGNIEHDKNIMLDVKIIEDRGVKK